MFRKIVEILSNRDLRHWLLWKARHPRDHGRRLQQSRPPYLEISTPQWTTPDRLELPKLPPFLSSVHSSQPPLVNLASCSISLGDFSNETIFSKRFDDTEDTFAIHRFGWILPLLNDGLISTENAAAILLRWIQNVPSPPEALHPYTISERFAHWGIFLCRSQCHEYWDQKTTSILIKSVNEQALLLLNNLEHYEEDLTGNHLANNARGLLWAALITGNTDFAKAGELIAMNELDRIVSTDGMLREGSSHYQFLITRNYFEMWWLSKILHLNNLANVSTERLPRMAYGCRFLRPQGQWPHIGDISPDAPPTWFNQVPEAVEFAIESEHARETVPANGWAANFFVSVPALRDATSGQLGDFTRLDQFGFSLLVHTSRHGHPFLPGHGHCDAGSAVAFWNRQPLLVDRGRATYTAQDRNALSTWFHNGIIIDGEELEFLPRGVFGPNYIHHRTGAPPHVRLTDHKIEIFHSGLALKKIFVTRSFEIKSDSVLIHTTIEGKGRREVQLLCHCADVEADITWPIGGLVYQQRGASPDPNLGSRSTKYGERIPCSSFIWKAFIVLPWRGTIVVQPKPAPQSST